MKLFNKNKVFAVAMLCFFGSLLPAACPVTCPTGLTGPRFCNLSVSGPLSAGSLCVQGNEQVGGNLTVCGTTTSFVSLTGGVGLTGPISFSTLSAFGFAWNPTLDLEATAGNNTVPLTNSSSLLNTTFAANALTPLISGTYLINYIIDLAGGDTAPSGTFSIFVNGAVVPGSEYDIGASESGAAVGQALASVVAGQPVIVNFNGGLAGTLLATSVSLTLEKVG